MTKKILVITEEDIEEDVEEDIEDTEDIVHIITIIIIVHIIGMIIYHHGRIIIIGEDLMIIPKYLLF
jgi:hypothetical protein